MPHIGSEKSISWNNIMSRKKETKTTDSKNVQENGCINTDEKFLDQTLRPNSWEEYIGQKNIKDNLKILLKAASQRKHPPEHLLFYGPPGLGKTTLANLIAKETRAHFHLNKKLDDKNQCLYQQIVQLI